MKENMSLPKLKYPTFSLKLPSSGKIIKYRGYTVAEEKILLICMQSKEIDVIVDNLLNLIKTCTMDTVNPKDLTPYDVEYLFLQMRMKSVSNILPMKFTKKSCSHEDCPKEVLFNIDLEKVNVQIKNDSGDYVIFDSKKTKSTKSIDLGNGISVQLKHPSLPDVIDVDMIENPIEKVYALAIKCVKSVTENDTVYDEFTEEEIVEFFNGMMSKQKDEIFEFVKTIPRIRHEEIYTCPKCGLEERIKFEGLEDFFG